MEINPEFLSSDSAYKSSVQNFLTEWRNSSATVEVQTSGSTGQPKIIHVEKEKMLASAKMTCQFLALDANQTALLCLPVEYISGKMMLVRAMVSGARIFAVQPILRPLENITRQINFCAMTPLQVENSIDKIHLIRKLIIGGAAVSEVLTQKIFHHLGNSGDNQIFETYGMSETLSHVALKSVFPVREPYFTTLPGVSIALNQRACLVIDAPALNTQKIVTNDLVEIVGSNQFRFLGRIDNVINSGGAKIFPEELEAFLKQKIPNELVILGIPDQSLGQKLVLVIEGNDDLHLKELVASLTFKKSYHKPKKLVFFEKFPRTPNGKLDRRALQKMLASP